MEENKVTAFGPVPSRRLGQSMGINNIPPKICTYSCIYCQLGRTIKVQTEREVFYELSDVKEDLLNITAVHPMREDSVEVFLERAHADWKEVKQLINNDQLIRTEYAGHGFYLRRFKRSHTH